MQDLPHSSQTLPVLAAALLAVSIDASLVAQTQPVWANVSPAAGPAGRYSHAMAYDSQRGVTVLFGGVNSSFASIGDTWEWDFNSWTNVSPTTGPSPRSEHTMAYDSQRGVTVLFGGKDASFNSLGDTWEWDGTSWTQVATTGPSARTRPGMAYDSQRGVSVMFGGAGNQPGFLNDTWEWNGSTWTQVATTGPTPRQSHAMTYDSQRGVSVVFGGLIPTFLTGDTWEWDGTTWTQVATTGPSGRFDTALVYDSARGASVLFGGSAGPGGLFSDTWEWNGTTWTQVATTGPSARGLHAMAYDSRWSATVLFAGDNGNFVADTWEHRAPVPPGVALYGTGCGSPTLTFLPVNAPIIGSTATCHMGQVPAPYLGAVALGFSNSSANGVALPIELTSLGLAGCFQRTSAEANPLPVTAGLAPGMLQFQVAIPNHPSWLSAKLYLQAYCLAPSCNPGGAITSNGIEWTIGDS